jgi:hypothetical protein
MRVDNGAALTRVVLLGLATWFALCVLTNLCDALVNLGIAPHLAFASGNFTEVRDTVARMGLPLWGAAALFALAILLEAAASGAFIRAFSRPVIGRVNTAFTVALLLFGGFVVMDEICTSYTLAGIHRGVVVFVAALYLVVRTAGTEDA